MADPQATDDLDALLARIASRTDALREGRSGVRLKPDTTAPEVPPNPDTTTRETERLLLADLTRAAERLRADAIAIGESLARVLDAATPAAEVKREEP